MAAAEEKHGEEELTSRVLDVTRKSEVNFRQPLLGQEVLCYGGECLLVLNDMVVGFSQKYFCERPA